MISKVDVFGIGKSMQASGYPKSVDTTNTGDYENTLKRVRVLAKAPGGSGHDCMLKGIVVQFDLKVPQYIWMQAERYSWFDIVSSQSKMHMIENFDLDLQCNDKVWKETKGKLKSLIKEYKANKTEDMFNEIISNVPMGFNLKARITTNYLQLKTIYFQRRYHKMKEWRDICEWIEALPLFADIVLNKKKEF